VRQPFEAWSWAVWGGRARRDSAAVQPGSAGTGWETELTARVHLIERECYQLGRHEPKRKTYFCGDAIDTWARWAGEEGFSL
jgi:hypothetical protein